MNNKMLVKSALVLLIAVLLCSAVSALPGVVADSESAVDAFSAYVKESSEKKESEDNTAELFGTYGDLEYSVSNGEITITGCSSSVTSVVIPETIEEYPVTGIGDYAFSWCESLESIIIPDSVTSIGEDAFSYCSGIKDVYYEGSLASWVCISFEDSASQLMSYANNLYIDGKLLSGSVVIPDGVTSIGDYAFGFRQGLTDITIPDSVTNIDIFAFYGCPNLKSFSVAENNEFYSNDSHGVLFNKNKTAIVLYPRGNSATEYIIPDGVTSIANCAFLSCSNLESITISDSVTSVGIRAFSRCSDLTNIVIGNGIKVIGDYTFEDCTGLESIIIPRSVTSISGLAFNYCSNLKSFSVAENNAFYSNDSNGVLFNKNKTKIIRYPDGNTATEYTVPDSVKYIGDYAFSNCYSITSVVVPKTVLQIGLGAFKGCNRLKEIALPFNGYSKETTFSAKDAFGYIFGYSSKSDYGTTEQIVQVKYPHIDWTIGKAYYYYIPYSLKKVIITGDDFFDFENCDRICNVVVPEGLESVNISFFGATGYKSVTIPDSVTEINISYMSGVIYGYSPSAAETYAKDNGFAFEERMYRISYDATNGVNVPPSQTKYRGEDTYLSDVKPIRNGYTFLGWSNAKGGTVVYNPGDIYAEDSAVTLYAVWDPHKYTVSYDPNGGIGAPEEQIKFHDEKLILSNVKPKLVGYTFYGWATSPNGNVVYNSSGSYSANKSVTLYAVWRETTYSITYNANGGSNAPASQTKKHFSDLVLSSSATAKSGYTFLGWATSAAGEVVYQPGDTYTTNESVTLYAVWEIITSGEFGDGLSWSFEDGVLTVSGEGVIPDFAGEDKVPWELLRTTINEIVIEDKITGIGNYTFKGCTSITDITIPDSVTRIGQYTFDGCSSLKEVVFGSSVRTIGNHAFNNCRNLLPDTLIPSNLDAIASSAFDVRVTYDGSSVQWEKRELNPVYNLNYKYGQDSAYITAIGAQQADPGDTLTYSVLAYSSVGSEYITAQIRYPKCFEFAGIRNMEFADSSADTPVLDGGFYTVTVTSQFSFEGEQTDGKTRYNAFDIFFTVKDDCPIGYYDIVFGEDTNFIGDTTEAFETYPARVFIYDDLEIAGSDIVSSSEKYSVIGKNSQNLSVKWSVTDETVATIDENGILTPKINGKVTIVADYTEKADISVRKTVSVVGNNVERIDIVGRDSITDGEVYSAVIYPESLRNKTVTWSVNDESVAKVSAYGVVTVLKEGVVTLRATVNDATGFYAEKQITVPCVSSSVSSLSSNIGEWNKDFCFFEHQYTIEVPAGTKQIELTATFDKGSLKCASSIMLNGKPLTVDLNSTKTVITLTRANVSGQEPSEYIITVLSGIPGDLTGDEEVDLEDAIYLLQYSMFPEDYPIDYADDVDYTKDGNVDLEDAIYLLQYSMFPEDYPLK